MRNMRKQRERGHVVWVVLVGVALVLAGLVIYQRHQQQQRAEKQQAEQAAKDAEARRLADLEARRADEERRVLEQRQSDARQKDALATALKSVDGLVARWGDAVRVAGATSRIALSGPLATLQSIRRETEGVTVPPCLDQAKPLLIKSMDESIEGFIVFMRNDFKAGDALSSIHMRAAAESMEAYTSERGRCPV